MKIQTCPECHGERLKPYPAATLLQGKRISATQLLTIAGMPPVFSAILKLTPQGAIIADELLKRNSDNAFHFLMEVGFIILRLIAQHPLFLEEKRKGCV